MIVDENGLNFDKLTTAQASEALTEFANCLEDFTDGKQVAIMDLAYDIQCWESVTFADLCYGETELISRDLRVRLIRLLDKCLTIEPAETDYPQNVQVDGRDLETSWGISHAIARSASGWATSAAVLSSSSWPSGWITLKCDSGDIEIHILDQPNGRSEFWRGVYSREPINQAEFFSLVSVAFPRLVFSDSLEFHRFHGSLPDVLPWIINLLSALNDEFSECLVRNKGDQNRIIAEFSSMGLDISPESPSTKANRKAWSKRLVHFGGQQYRCEWHGKRLSGVDRVHFSLPIPEHEGRVLIGIFTDHLAL